MNKKRNSVSTKIKNPLLLVVLLMIATILVVFLYNSFFKKKLESVYSLKQTYEEKSSLPILTSINTASLERRAYYHLRPRGILSYNQQVRAVSTDNDSPLAPTAVEVIDAKVGGTLVIFWQKPADADYKSISIYRSDVAGQLGQKVVDNLSASGNYKDADLQDNQKYYYILKSVNNIEGEDKESANTNYYEGVPTDKTPPAAPMDFKVANTGEGGALHLSWRNPADEDFAYVLIYRSEKLGVLDADSRPVKVEGEEEYLDQEVKDNTVYYYTVTAVDASGNESSRELLLSSGGNSQPFYTPSTNANTNG